jgi:hypothetical protein
MDAHCLKKGFEEVSKQTVAATINARAATVLSTISAAESFAFDAGASPAVATEMASAQEMHMTNDFFIIVASSRKT